MSRSVYLDYAATTPIDQRVVDAMYPHLAEHYGNPSSLYRPGREAARALNGAREMFSAQIGAAHPEEIIFTGGGTESDNTAVFGLAREAKRATGRTHIVVSSFEHKGVLSAAGHLSKNGFELTLVDPGSNGVVSADSLQAALKENTALVSVMHVNNEIGTVQPIAELASVAHEGGALFHTDAVQSVGKVDFDARSSGVDAASFSAHKIYGPKGVGALYLRDGVAMQPLIVGGGQEGKRRSGTPNVAGVVGMAEALRIINAERAAEEPRLLALRDRVIDSVLGMENTLLNGERPALAPHIANFIIKGVEGESMLLQLDDKGIYVSTGSACSAGSLEPSHVLTAIGCPPEWAHGSLRVSVGRFTREEDVEYFLAEFETIVQRLRGMSPNYQKTFGSG